MPKQHGKHTRWYINGLDFSPYLNATDVSLQADMAESSGYGWEWKTNIPGMKGGSIRAAGHFDNTPTTGLSAIAEDYLRNAPSPIITVVGKDELNNRGYGMVGYETSFGQSHPIAGIVAISADFIAEGSLHPLKVIYPRGTLNPAVAGGTSDAYNGGTALALGATAYLQALSIVAGSPVVTVRHSANGTSGWSTLLSFAAQTVVGAQRVNVTGTVQPYQSVTVSGGTLECVVGISIPKG